MERAHVKRGARVRDALIGSASIIARDTEVGYQASDRSRFTVMPAGLVVVPPGYDRAERRRPSPL